MKNTILPLLAIVLGLSVACSSHKNASSQSVHHNRKADPDNPFGVEKYTSIGKAKKYKNDALNVHHYTLENGMQVFVSPNDAEPRIQTLVLVKAGSIHDPKDATGLAHYLEHMLFKGNDKIGTINYEAEIVEINKIKALFQSLKAESDPKARENIYAQIDSISAIAGQYACPNEIDQLFTQIGATGTNAYTSKEFTGYINNIPANQLENWLSIESERYKNPVLRLFHTELEAVYEEKNISLDKADRRMNEEFSKALWPNHNYGLQTNIGTIEHLKSPSMYAIEDFFNTYYVPNNMGIFLSGDIEPDSAVSLVNKYFSSYRAKEVPKYEFDKSHQLKGITRVDISSKEAPHLMIGFRFPGAGSEDALKMVLVDMLLNNRTAGLFDLDINQKQKALNTYSHPYILKDYSTHEMGGQPNPGQSLSELEALILKQIERLKQGDFHEWMIEAVVNDLKKSDLESNRSNKSRVSKLSRNFAHGLDWQYGVDYYNKLASITKEELVNFVQKNYKENYVVLHRTQDTSATSLKVSKPQITPIDIPSGNRSEFLKGFAKRSLPKEIEASFPVYSDYLKEEKLGNGLSLISQLNTKDSLFSLSYIIPFGTENNKSLALAFSYADLCSSKEYSLRELNEQWYKLGVDFSMSTAEEEAIMTISGLEKNRDAAIDLMFKHLKSLQADSLQMEILKARIAQVRVNGLKSKRNLMWTGLKNYLVYNSQSLHMDKLSNAELANQDAQELLKLFQSTLSRINEVYYYGPSKTNGLKQKLEQMTISSSKREDVVFERVPTMDQHEFYLLDFDMQQAEILMMNKNRSFSKEDQAIIALFNEYFGGGMSSIVFQEIREKKALAYSVYAGYTRVSRKDDPHYVLAYIGTQADKYIESIEAMMGLFEELPYDSLKFEQSKQALLQKYATGRIAEHGIIGSYRTDKDLGYDYDKRRDIYNQVSQFEFGDLVNFFEERIKNQKYRIAILGNLDVVKKEKLAEYGTVKELTIQDIFPY